MLGGQSQDECNQDKADGSLFFRREDEDLAPDRRLRTLLLHSTRGLTWSDRYLRRMFWS